MIGGPISAAGPVTLNITASRKHRVAITVSNVEAVWQIVDCREDVGKPGHDGFVSLFELSNISHANEMAGSHLGSQRRQVPAHARRRSAAVVTGERHAGRHPALSGDPRNLIWEQEAAGSNPAIPTISAGQLPYSGLWSGFQNRLTVI